MKNMISLSSALSYFGVAEKQDVHKSDDDSLMTLEVLRNLCLAKKTSPSILALKYPTAVNELRDGNVIQLRRDGKAIREVVMGDRSDNAEYGSDNFICARRYIYHVKGEVKNNSLSGKRVYIYPGYIYKNYRNTVKLIKLIADCGGQVCEVLSQCDLYVYAADYDEFGNVTIRPSFNDISIKGKNLTLVSAEELVEITGGDYSLFLNAATPNISHLIDDIYEIRAPMRRRPFRRRKKNHQTRTKKITRE